MKSAGLRTVLVLAAVYLVVGILFGALAGRATSHQVRIGWRWAAWIVSAIAFGAHIAYEQLHRRTAPKITALYVSLAAGLGAFTLAVAANIHAQTAASPHRHSLALALSLLVWPIMTVVPAFVVAIMAATLVARVRPRTEH